MIVGRVAAQVTGSVQHPAYDGRTLYVVQPVDSGGTGRAAIVAVDTVGAGLGDEVLVARVPGMARSLLGRDRAPIRSLILAILDRHPD
jgi:ethanolamine utilization protein EutN